MALGKFQTSLSPCRFWREVLFNFASTPKGKSEQKTELTRNAVTKFIGICANEAVSVKLKSPSTTSDSLADSRTRDIYAERKASRSGGCLILLIGDRLLTGDWRDRNPTDKLAKPSKIRVFMCRKSSGKSCGVVPVKANLNVYTHAIP